MKPARGVQPPDYLSRRVFAAVRVEQAATLRPAARNAIALIVAGIIAVALVVAASHIVHGNQATGLHANLKSPSALLLVSMTLPVLALAAVLTALWRGSTGLGARATLLAITGLVTPPIYALLTLAFPVHDVADTVGAVHLSPFGARCVLLATLVGAVVMGSLAFALRAAAPVDARLRGLVVGSASGACAGLAVFVFCPAGDVAHLLVGHVLPVVAFSLVGAAALPALLRP